MPHREVELCNFIQKNIKQTDTIVFIKPRMLYLYTGRVSLEVNDKNLKDHKYYIFYKNSTNLLVSPIYSLPFSSFLRKYRDNNPSVRFKARNKLMGSDIEKIILFENEKFQFIKIAR